MGKDQSEVIEIEIFVEHGPELIPTVTELDFEIEFLPIQCYVCIPEKRRIPRKKKKKLKRLHHGNSIKQNR